MSYIPGLHILSQIYSSQFDLLTEFKELETFLNSKIIQYQLTKVGEIYHSFEPGGYTATICLTESHIALHTWPEHGILTLDIYLSNNLKKNDEKAKALFQDILQFFKSIRHVSQEVIR